MSRGAQKVASEDRQSQNTGFQTVAPSPVTATCAAVGPQVGQKSRLDDSSGDDFSAAVMAVMALPLSDSEKAETVRRLLAATRSMTLDDH